MVNTATKVARGTVETTEARLEQQTFVFNATDEQRLNQLEQVQRSTEGMVMLIYDIPSAQNAEVPNPSTLLWHYGFRLNKSCWVLPNKSVEAPAIQELLAFWTEHEIEQHIIPYAEHAIGQIKEIARKKISQELVRIHTSLITRLESASQRLDQARAALEAMEKEGAAITEADYLGVEHAHETNLRMVFKQSISCLEGAIRCAELFDETEQVSDLLNGLKQAIRAEALAFNAEMSAKNSKGVNLPKSVGYNQP